jgi:hypothetical protein
MDCDLCLTYSPNWYDRHCLLPLPHHLLYCSNADIVLLAMPSKAVRNILHVRKHVHDKELRKVGFVARGVARIWFGGSLGYFGRVGLDPERDCLIL